MSKIQKRQMELKVTRQNEVDGIEMGVLDDGTPYLTQRGLAVVCGVAPSVITQWSQAYDPDSLRRRDQVITRLLSAQGFGEDSLYTTVEHEGRSINAYPDTVCMAVLEYYAFEAKQTENETARRNYRTLARASLREYIYRTLGYDPNQTVSDAWKQFHARVTLNRVPVGHFSVFREMSDILVDAIRNGMPADSHTVPDISVGIAWGKNWKEKGMGKAYGERRKFPHTYPDSFPQSQADVQAHIYPVAALPAFRTWLHRIYLPTKYPQYLKRKVRAGALPASSADLMIAAATKGQLTSGDDEG